MTDTKRKSRDDGRDKSKSKRKFKKQKASNSKAPRKNRGPRLPSSLQKELERLTPATTLSSDEEIASDVDNDEGALPGNDLYEYEEEHAEEESRKNKRYDPVRVDKSEYEMPDVLSDEFQDENLQSGDESDDDDDCDGDNMNEKDSSDNSGEEDDERHARMLQGITGMPSEAFEEKKTKKKNATIPELYPESEYNPSRDVLSGDGHIGVEDLLNSLHGKPGFSKLRRRVLHMEKNAKTVHAPLPKPYQAKVDREAAYANSNKEITKWEPIIKRNREAPTIFFDENENLGFSTVGAIASAFEPRTGFEKKIAALVHDDKVVDAHKNDGARLLELNKISIEDEKERQNRMAKMRSFLFHHEMKAKHIKKIKSKTYHRLLKKDRSKAVSSQIEMDPEAAKEFAMKQERQRAEERMTLRHKNKNRWAKRILERGLNTQDEGTRAAIAEQLQRHAELTRKMNSMKESSSSSDDTSDEDDVNGNSDGSDQDKSSKLLVKAKEKTIKVLEEEGEAPTTGLLSLPFMRRGLEKRKEEAAKEAKLALQEYENSLKNMENPGSSEDAEVAATSGRMVFGTAKPRVSETSKNVKSDNLYGSSDSEDDLGARENSDMVNKRSNDSQKNADDDSLIIADGSDTHQESLFKDLNEIIKDPGPKTTYEVAIFVSDTWKKAKNRNGEETDKKKPMKLTGPPEECLKTTEKEFREDSDTDSEGQMVDGILSSGPKVSYDFPSQEDLIRQAFAGDNVEDDFEKDKLEILNEEIPEPEKPLLLPGWGQWTNVQQKKGIPSWMLKEHENAKKKREESLKKRKDAHLKHVIISEKLDKRAEKLHTKTLPYPFTSKEVFEQSMRMPIGPEFNPATAIRALNRPEVVKRPGVIIKPIEFEDVNPHEKTQKPNGEKHKLKNEAKGGKTKKMTKAGGK